MKIRLLWMAAIAVVCLLVPGKSLHAQSNETSNAKLTGVLTDPSGAVVGGAIVRAIPSGGAAIAASSGADGRFTLSLNAGRYRVVIVATSFTRVEQEFLACGGGDARMECAAGAGAAFGERGGERHRGTYAGDIGDVSGGHDHARRHQPKAGDLARAFDRQRAGSGTLEAWAGRRRGFIFSRWRRFEFHEISGGWRADESAGWGHRA